MTYSDFAGSLHPRIRVLRASAIATALATLVAAGCTSKKQEATEKLNKEIKKCRASDGPIYDVPIMQGSDETPVLTAACTEQKGDVEMVDEFTAELQVGPYTWEAGRDQTIGVWTIKSVSWPPLDEARTMLEDKPEKNELERAVEKLREAQQEFSKSGWVRLKLLDTMIALRKKGRKSDKSGLSLGEDVEKQFQSTIEWANSNEDRAAEARARLKVIDYLKGFIDQLDGARDAIGSQDDYYKRSAEVAEEEGNEEKAEKYRKELKNLKEQRPQKRKRYDNLVDETETALCSRLSELRPDGIEDDELQQRVQSAKNGINCRELLQNDSGPE